ncbi:uncharacterized protein ColSpa_04120 [Colletotrichum spaethianum]|uniref:LIM zinc-binding domain-containing protein n=1 Tax=Colletotrichum spaethianum TaxID=700344 RepID=A0AA37P7H5_9PEZI|nr:uncharacterized protein ColSpa_04120 [Colletotrichum spaethianum]GKT43939.1 hypothetical protein ColSpa_04120 [Colletotrichum spaethianum]
MAPHASVPFTCTFCYQPSEDPPHALGPEARLTCSPCHAALIDLAICWVCGEIVYRGDECCFWHRSYYGCLFCGSKLVYRGVPLLELFNDSHDVDEEGSTTRRVAGTAGKGRMKEVDVPPLCAACYLGMEGEDVMQQGLKRVEKVDGGLSRARWDAGEARAGHLRRAPASFRGVARFCAYTGHINVRYFDIGVGKVSYTNRPTDYTRSSSIAFADPTRLFFDLDAF